MTSLNLENLYYRIFNSAIVAIGVTDKQGKYLMVNPTWCELLGYSCAESLDVSVQDVTPRDDLQTSIINFDYLMAESGRSIRKKRRYQRKDGSIFWADLYASALYDADDKALGLLGVFVDIDNQVTAEENQRVLIESMEKLNMELTVLNADLRRLSRHDTLTGLFNRRVLEEIMEKENIRAVRTKRGFGVAIADIDNFKKVNDTYGHDAGDTVLKEISLAFLKGIRNMDIVGRWGGEEFMFIFPETSCQGAMVVIERIRSSIEKTQIIYQNVDICPTITIGLSFHSGEDMEIVDIVAEADKAMYKGKTSGKNRVVCYQDMCTE
ncbi:MAG: sensor domain-containing diguanylate cyclase [Candidatus Cloacimonas sp.]|jgi:diguanylate cyclase (GGDEF)-like protein/PAS domain S-box-containing protein|nr:sensor domain-containing diguanylate cyclase [Candidatus Cloacimonas sp.]